LVLQWANAMVMKGSRAMIEDRWVVVSVLLNDCRSVVVGADVVGVMVEGRQGRLNKLRIPNDDGFVYTDQWGGWLRSRKNGWHWWRQRCGFTK
jgi:hypothetical protein